MIHGDPQQRAARLAEVTEILKRDADPGDRDLVLSLAPVLFAEMPARLALDLPAPVIAARLRAHFRFIAREMPPSHQLYKGLPGIHVSVRNPDEEEARALGGGAGLPLETTLVETHTPDRPFIFESLKNYLQKQGVRVFSAVHPIFTVRRQWERATWFGGPHDEGSKESYCCFQIERVESRERCRRIEHEVFSLLKAVFLAVDDFADMGRVCRDLVPRVRSRTGDASELASARAFLEWLLDDNYIFMGTVSYRLGPDGTLDRADETATGVFTDPTLLPVVFPGVVEHVETHLKPTAADDRIVDLDFCTNATAIYHIEPIEDLTVREWDERGPARRPHAAPRPVRAGRLRAARRPDPDPEGEARLAAQAERGPARVAHLARDPRGLQPVPEDGAVLRGRGRPQAGDRPHRARGERRRGRGAEARRRRVRGAVRGLLAPALLVPGRAGAAPRGGRRVRPGDVRDLLRLRAADPLHLLLRHDAARAAGGRRRGLRARRAPRHELGGPGRRRARADVRRGPRARDVPPVHHAGVAQRPLPRVDVARPGAGRRPALRGARGPAGAARRAEGGPRARRSASTPSARSTSPTS